MHLDYLSKMTDDTLERRKQYIPQAEAIIDEVKEDFDSWLETRKFAPTIRALKKKLTSFKDAEINLQRKKYANFDEEQADMLSNRIIQKITNHFANHLKDEDTSSEESLELIQKVFQLQNPES